MPLNVIQIDTKNYSRILAISDIHGDLLAFDELLKNVKPRVNDLIITLGDYVDKGLFSAQVIERLIEMHESHQVFSLLGNHDEWMLESKEDSANLEFWQTIAGPSTLASYEQETIDAVPDQHWNFLSEICVDAVETEEFIFVHGHLEPHAPLLQQDAGRVRMLRHDQASAHMSGKTVVCGHKATNSGTPEHQGHTIATDTKEWLNCVDVLSGHVWRTKSDLSFIETELKYI